MAGFAGSALNLRWITPGGTLQVDTDFRTFSYTPSAEYYEETAGAATYKEYQLAGRAGQASAGGVMQAGSMYTYATALAAGQLGTLIWCPEGTAAGKYHGTAAFYSQGFKFQEQYNQILEWSCDFMQTGAMTDGTAGG